MTSTEIAKSKWSRQLVGQIVEWLQKAYPAEGCGLIVVDEDGNWEFRSSENVIDRYHAIEPEIYTRTSRDFYMIDPRQFMRADERGETVAVIVHSHPDTGDYFSDADVSAALMPRESDDDPVEPLYPETDYLVVSVCDGSARSASLYRFDKASAEFQRAARFTGQQLQESLSCKGVQEETVA